MKRILSFILALLLLSVSFVSVNAEQTVVGTRVDLSPVISAATEKGFTSVADNNNYTLYFNNENTEFAVLVKKSGKMWYSNPQLTREQTIERSSGNDKIKSQISITLLDQFRTPGNFINSNSASVRDGNFTVEDFSENGKKTGVIVTYDFVKDVHKFRIPLVVSLTDTGLKLEILFDKIEEYGTSSLCSVELAPMFGAALPEEEGYLFIPDGSGALVDFNGMPNNFSDYSDVVYGKDPSVNLKDRTVVDNEGIKMPVFGAKVNDDAYFAIITNGDGYATINASSSVARYKLATVWSSFHYREYDETGLIGQDSVSRTVRMSDSVASSANPTVEYTFLSHDKANYSGMANYYRDYLVNKYSLKKVSTSKVNPLLQFYGKTYSSESVFGIPIDRALTATTFEQAKKFNEQLKLNGVEQSTIYLYGFQKGGFENKHLSKFSVDGKVGGKKGLQSLIESAGAGNVYMAFDLIRDYNFGGLFKGSRYTSSMNNVTITKQYGLLSTGAWKGTDAESWKYLTNSTLLKDGNKLIKSFNSELGYGVVFQNVGSEVYNDFDEKTHADRQQFLTSYSTLHTAVADKGINVGSDGANIYMLENATVLSEIPTESSGDMLLTRSVPFYSMVVHGYVKTSSMPINNAYDKVKLINECSLYGIMPTYRLTSLESNRLKNSNLRFLYNTGFSSWESVIPSDYKYINSVAEGLADQLIVSHEYSGNLSIVEYENGVKLVYNQSRTEYASYEGKEIAPSTVVRI